jgi:hypothetical protein
MIVEDGKFATAVASILSDPERHGRMRVAAREYALGASWDSVFEGVYSAYKSIVVTAPKRVPVRATP